jgi:Spy/CpxP family protein refolding chaperone
MKFLSSPRVFAGAVLLAVASSVTLSAAAFEGQRHGGRHAGGAAMMGAPMHGRMLEHMLDSVKATDAQRAQIRQIAESAKTDMKAQREQRRAMHEQGMKLFTQPTVDGNAVEALRQQMLAQHDQASKRRMTAMIEISRVLTPEQRQQLAERSAQRREMRERHMRERAQLHGDKSSR